jgi:hypothetical protein
MAVLEEGYCGEGDTTESKWDDYDIIYMYENVMGKSLKMYKKEKN